jgi:hypothetical protein
MLRIIDAHKFEYIKSFSPSSRFVLFKNHNPQYAEKIIIEEAEMKKI